MSGLISPSITVGPFELYVVSSSSDRAIESCVFNAPAVITYGSLPGDSMPPNTLWPAASFPRLPAAATTTMPACTARSTAAHNGSSLYDSSTACPSERLITLMLYRFLFLMAHWIAAKIGRATSELQSHSD